MPMKQVKGIFLKKYIPKKINYYWGCYFLKLVMILTRKSLITDDFYIALLHNTLRLIRRYKQCSSKLNHCSPGLQNILKK